MAYVEREYSSNDRRNEDMFTLYVTNLPEELNKDGIAQIFQAFGEIRILSPDGAKWAFVSYKTYKEAEHAIRALDDRSPLHLKVAFQKKKTQQKLPPYSPGPADLSQENLVKDFRYADTRIGPNANCRGVMPGMLGAHLTRYAGYNNECDANSVYPSELDHNIYNPFENLGRYAGTSAMWSRGSVNVDEYGKRHVSMGRGFTRYHIPDPHPNMERQIGRVYENRRAGLYEYGEDRLHSRVGKCQLCTRVTTLQCEQCAGFYCSRECQVDDWARHKMECKTIPGLVGAVEVVPLSRSSSDDQLQVPRKPGGMDLRTVGGLRRPKTVPKIADSEQNSTLDEAATSVNRAAPLTPRIQPEIATKSVPPAVNVSQPSENVSPNFEYNETMRKKFIDRTNQPNQSQRYDENSNDLHKPNAGQQDGPRNLQNGFRTGDQSASHSRDNNRPFNRDRNFSSARGTRGTNAAPRDAQSSGSQSEGMSEQAKKNLMKMDEELAFQRDPPAPSIAKVAEKQMPLASSTLSRSETVSENRPAQPAISNSVFTSVVVVFPMPDGSFWVHRQEDSETITKMMLELHTKAKCYPAASERIVGETYAVLYADQWHRATLVSKNPTIIFYIDYGNEEPPQSEDFRLLTDFPKYPPYAIRVRLAAGSRVKTIVEDAKLSVKMIAVDKDGVVEVVVDGTTAEVDAAPTATAKIAPSIVEASKLEVLTPSSSKVAAFSAPRASNAAAFSAPSASKVAAFSAPSASNATASSAPSTTNATASSAPSASKIADASAPSASISSVAEPRTEKKVAFTLPTSTDSLDTNIDGFIQVYLALDNLSYAVCVLNPALADDYSMVYDKLGVICGDAKPPANYAPQIGDFVCGRRETVWLRGYVLSLGPPIRLALVDEARVSPVEQVIPMPPEFEKICSFGAICAFEAPGSAFEPEAAAQFTVTAVDHVAGERIVRASLQSSDNLNGVRITLKNWTPTSEQKGIGFAELKSSSEVCITAYSNERVMYVRSLDPASLERSRRIDQNVAKWAQKAPKLDGPPTIGQLVIAKFTDGNFYRAIVTKLQDEKIGVSYVDYGNCDFTTIEDLRVLSDELKEEKSCAAKVVLKDIVADVPPTQEVHQYLNLLVGKEQPLFCTFDKIPSKDGVILTTATGECVNLKVNELLTPAWKREDPSKDTKCFTMVDLEYAKLGEVGETKKVLVLYASDAPFNYFMCPYDEDHIRHVSDLLPALLEAYCSSTKEHYIPRQTELCIAPYEGAWYRGLCLNPSETPTQARIHFIDFGNIDVVDHTNLRQTTKDFMAPPALACMCKVQNPGIELEDGKIPANIKARLDALIPCNDLVEVKIVKKVDDGEYILEVPHLRQTLVAEGLIK